MPNRLPRIVVTRNDHARLSALASAALETHPETVAALIHGLNRAKVVPPGKIGRGVVTMNSRIKFLDDLTGEKKVVTLVYPVEEDVAAGRLSVLSPAGAALIGLEEGESITYVGTDGAEKSLTVTKVQYQPESHGRFDI
ncbi:MAG: nucleoside diphosphate kinase regulator [Rhodospirillales bacterium]|jgi:regulator of nucleoside diphosphate kinase|nr:nucleoside diphosphate kinase regulator [Rhodospirillales bacterium]